MASGDLVQTFGAANPRHINQSEKTPGIQQALSNDYLKSQGLYCVRELTNRNWGVSMNYQLFRLSQYLRGWINYFGIANQYQLCVELDHWIRRRVRMAYWRQWRKPRTKVRNLIRLGVPIQSAVACGITSKGPCRSSKTPGIQQALSNDYLKSQGLYSLREGWIRLHYSE